MSRIQKLKIRIGEGQWLPNPNPIIFVNLLQINYKFMLKYLSVTYDTCIILYLMFKIQKISTHSTESYV